MKQEFRWNLQQVTRERMRRKKYHAGLVLTVFLAFLAAATALESLSTLLAFLI